MATKKLTKGQLIDQLSTFRAGSGTTIVYLSTPQMRKTDNPYYGRVTKITKFSGVQMGTDFTKAKINSAKRSGAEFKPEESNSPRKHNMVYLNKMVLKDNESGDLYVPIQWTEKSAKKGTVKFEYTYLLDERPMTQSEFMDFAEKYQSPSSTYVPKDQENFDPDEIRKYLTLKLDNILTVKQGDKLLRLK